MALNEKRLRTIEKFRETGNIGYTRRRQEKQIHSTICVGHRYSSANTNKVNKTLALLKQLEEKTNQTVFMRKS